jgi:hypothetical protein
MVVKILRQVDHIIVKPSARRRSRPDRQIDRRVDLEGRPA